MPVSATRSRPDGPTRRDVLWPTATLALTLGEPQSDIHPPPPGFGADRVLVPITTRRTRGAAGKPAERFGGQVRQLQGGAEHRSERIQHTRSEERRSRRGRWRAWTLKIRSGFSAAPLGLRAAGTLQLAHRLLCFGGSLF